MKYPRIEAIILFIIFSFIGVHPANADDPHAHTTIINKNISNLSTTGAALSLAASAHQFDWSTHDFQGSIGFGYYDSNAISFGLGKRFGRALINGSVGAENGKTGFSGSINWHLK